MSAILVGFWNREGECHLRNEVVEVVPRIGEGVSIVMKDDTYINARVIGVTHSIPKPATGEAADIRVNVLLDLD